MRAEQNTEAPTPRQVRLLLEPEVRARLGGISHSTLWRMMRDSALEFPKPVTLSKRRVAWIESQIDAFIASRPVAPAYRGKA